MVMIEEALLEWSVVVGPSTSLVAGAVASGDRTSAVVTSEFGDEVVLGVRGAEAQRVHTPGLGWIVQQVLFVDKLLVDVVSNDSTHQSALYRLAPGADPVVLEAWDGDARHIPEIASSGSLLWYTTRREPEVVCIAELDTDSGLTRDVHCGQRGSDIGWLSASGTHLSFVESDGSECGRLMRIEPSSPTPPTLVSEDACVFQGVASKDVVAWVEDPTTDSEGFVDFFAVPIKGFSNGMLVELGLAAAGSLMICDDALFWLRSREGASASEIRTWQPDEPIRIIYRSPDEGEGRVYATSRPSCSADGRVLVQRAGWQAGAPDELLIQGSHDWVLDVSPAESAANPDLEQ